MRCASQSSYDYDIDSVFENGEFVSALLTVQYKQTLTGPKPSTTSFNIEKVSNGIEPPSAESYVKVDGSVNIAVGDTDV